MRRCSNRSKGATRGRLRRAREIIFKSSARILTRSLREAIRDADLVGENVKIEVAGDMLKMSAVGDMGSAFSDWERGSDEFLELKAEEDSGATFTLSYLKERILINLLPDFESI
jgi:hypothetical protein